MAPGAPELPVPQGSPAVECASAAREA